MIKFLYRGNWYEVDKKYRYLAVDRDGEVWLYAEMPTVHLDEGYWDSTVCGESMRLLNRVCNEAWATSLVALDDLITA